MALNCSLSNEVPEEPVISPVSGAIFERRLVTKYIAENGVDPISSEPLTVEQLIAVKTPPVVKPRPPSVTSIPAILKALQDEWDAVMLHSFQLRQQLQTARQELSHALYQHDAACRVIARLNKELNSAREALATLKPQAGLPAAVAEAAGPAAIAPAAAGEAGAAVDAADAPLSAEVLSQLQDKATVLTQERKKRGKSVPENLCTAEAVRGFKTLASHPGLHSAGTPGILCLDVQASDPSRLVTGGNDKQATVFNRDTEQVVAVLKGHSKKITRVIYHPTEDTVITCSPDSQIRVWDVKTSQTVHMLRAHSAAVTGLSLHATGDFVLSTSLDQHWAFSDIRVGRVLTQVQEAGSHAALTAAQFHPDGLIFATGTSDALIKIWDLKERANVANFPGHMGEITSISFSENGYYLATAAEDSTVKLWDLRKLKNFKTIALEEAQHDYKVKDLCFDTSGAYLAVAGSDVRVYLCKQWQELAVFNDHTALATGVRFGQNAQYIASVSMDRTLKTYGTPLAGK